MASRSQLKIKKNLFMSLAVDHNNTLQVISQVKHCRSNQRIMLQVSLPYTPLGTVVELQTDHKNVHLINNVSVVKMCDNGSKCASFSSLRLIGKSGRGKEIDLFIVVKNKKPGVYKLAKAIKVTVDGMRPPRKRKKSTNPDSVTDDSSLKQTDFQEDSLSSNSSSSMSSVSSSHSMLLHPMPTVLPTFPPPTTTPLDIYRYQFNQKQQQHQHQLVPISLDSSPRYQLDSNHGFHDINKINENDFYQPQLSIDFLPLNSCIKSPHFYYAYNYLMFCQLDKTSTAKVKNVSSDKITNLINFIEATNSLME